MKEDHMGKQSGGGSKTLLGMKQLSPKEKGSGLKESASDVKDLGKVTEGSPNS